MSDQTEKPDGALPKGYDTNTPSTEITRRKKLNFKKLFTVTPTDQDQREKDLQEYESSYLARIERKAGPKPEESSDSFLVDLAEDEEPKEDLGKLNLVNLLKINGRNFKKNEQNTSRNIFLNTRNQKESQGKRVFLRYTNQKQK